MPPYAEGPSVAGLAPLEFPGHLQPRQAPAVELSTAAMQRFSCTAGACEDTCCRGLGIAMEHEDARRIRAAGARNTVRLVVLDAVRVENGVQHILRLDESGACPALQIDGRCGVHASQGQGALATACAVFPRTALAVRSLDTADDRIEVTGSLACPELSRLTLLSPDGPTQSLSPASLLPRPYVGKAVRGDESDPYGAPFLRVRGVLVDLLGRTGFPLASRLVFAAHLAAQVEDFFFQGTPAFDGAAQRFARQRLDAELGAATDPTLLQRLHDDLAALGQGAGEGAFATTASMLNERGRLPHATRFTDLVQGCLRSLQAEAIDQAATPSRLFEVYVRRRDLIARRVPGLVDDILGRYAVHYLLRHPYTDAPSLLVYLGRLALALGAVRLLLVGSPAVKARLDGAPDPRLDAEMLSSTTAEVVQRLTKAITHHVEFLAAIHRANETSGVRFGTLVVFAKFL